jgi:hypothetical protein|tara:strand:- start:488 stop:700 length:213 start_codon:yes stop_codon:yes gene_type:complete
MANLIKELFTLSREEQEFILENMSHEYNPIEIDGQVFMIPKEVNDLIDKLVNQVSELEVKPKKSIAKEAH